jgi:hypothetical protein
MNLNLLYCYLSGHHDFGVHCEPGEIFLRCIHCGKRSAGWALKGAKSHAANPVTVSAKPHAKADKRAAPSTAPVVASV